MVASATVQVSGLPKAELVANASADAPWRCQLQGISPGAPPLAVTTNYRRPQRLFRSSARRQPGRWDMAFTSRRGSAALNQLGGDADQQRPQPDRRARTVFDARAAARADGAIIDRQRLLRANRHRLACRQQRRSHHPRRHGQRVHAARYGSLFTATGRTHLPRARCHPAAPLKLGVYQVTSSVPARAGRKRVGRTECAETGPSSASGIPPAGAQRRRGAA